MNFLSKVAICLTALLCTMKALGWIGLSWWACTALIWGPVAFVLALIVFALVAAAIIWGAAAIYDALTPNGPLKTAGAC